jgi:hypothetical protein
MRRLTSVGTALLVGALALAAAVPASSQQGRGQSTIRVIEVHTEENFLDLGHRGPSLGDELVFHGDLRSGGESIGHDGGTCTLTSLEEGPEGEFQCVVSLLFDDGQITAQGLIQFSDDEFEVAITGGTGAYEGAVGHIRVVPRTEKRAHLTISLLT